MDSKKFVQQAHKRLKELGHTVPLGHMYEAFAQGNGKNSWNVESASPSRTNPLSFDKYLEIMKQYNGWDESVDLTSAYGKLDSLEELLEEFGDNFHVYDSSCFIIKKLEDPLFPSIIYPTLYNTSSMDMCDFLVNNIAEWDWVDPKEIEKDTLQRHYNEYVRTFNWAASHHGNQLYAISSKLLERLLKGHNVPIEEFDSRVVNDRVSPEFRKNTVVAFNAYNPKFHFRDKVYHSTLKKMLLAAFPDNRVELEERSYSKEEVSEIWKELRT